jgi:hypothetical protein
MPFRATAISILFNSETNEELYEYNIGYEGIFVLSASVGIDISSRHHTGHNRKFPVAQTKQII